MAELWDLVQRPIPEDAATCTAFLTTLASGLRQLCNGVLAGSNAERRASLHTQRTRVLTYIVSHKLPALLCLFPTQPRAILTTAYLCAAAQELELLSKERQLEVLARVQECLCNRSGMRKFLLYLVYTQSFETACVEAFLPKLLPVCVGALRDGSVSEVFQALQVVEYFCASFPRFMEEEVAQWFVSVYANLTHEKSNIRRAVSRVFQVVARLLLSLHTREIPELCVVSERQLRRVEEMCEECLLPTHAVLFGYIVVISHQKMCEDVWRKRVRDLALNKLKMNKISSTCWCWRFVIEAYVQAGLVDKMAVAELQSVFTDVLDSPANVAFPTWTYFICALNKVLQNEEVMTLVARPFLQGNAVELTQARYFLSIFFESGGDHNFKAPPSYFASTRLKCLTNDDIVPSVVRLPLHLFARMLPLVLECKPLCKLMSPGNPVSPCMHFDVLLRRLHECPTSRQAFLLTLQNHRAIEQIIKLVAYDMKALLANDAGFNCRLWILVAGAVEVWRSRELDESRRAAAALALLLMPFDELAQSLFTFSSVSCIWSQLFHELYSNRFVLPKKEQDICQLFTAIETAFKSKTCDSRQLAVIDACLNSIVLRVATSTELGNSGLSPAGWCFRVLTTAMANVAEAKTTAPQFQSLTKFAKKARLAGDALEMTKVVDIQALYEQVGFEDTVIQVQSTLKLLKRQIQIQMNDSHRSQIEHFLAFCLRNKSQKLRNGAVELVQSLNDAELRLFPDKDVENLVENHATQEQTDLKIIMKSLPQEEDSTVAAPELSSGRHNAEGEEEEEATQIGVGALEAEVVATQVIRMPPPKKPAFVRINAKKRSNDEALTSRQKAKLRKTCNHLDMYGLNQSATFRPEYEFNYLLSQTQSQTQVSPAHKLAQTRATSTAQPLVAETKLPNTMPNDTDAGEATLDQTLVQATKQPSPAQTEQEPTQVPLQQTISVSTLQPTTLGMAQGSASNEKEFLEEAYNALAALQGSGMEKLTQEFRTTLERVRRL